MSSAHRPRGGCHGGESTLVTAEIAARGATLDIALLRLSDRNTGTLHHSRVTAEGHHCGQRNCCPACDMTHYLRLRRSIKPTHSLHWQKYNNRQASIEACIHSALPHGRWQLRCGGHCSVDHGFTWKCDESKAKAKQSNLKPKQSNAKCKTVSKNLNYFNLNFKLKTSSVYSGKQE